jgi:hypothetical protein
MIKQIINSKEELCILLRQDLIESAEQHENTEEELNEQIQTFLDDDAPEQYPVFAIIDNTFLYHGFDIDLYTTCEFLTKEEIIDLYNKII